MQQEVFNKIVQQAAQFKPVNTNPQVDLHIGYGIDENYARCAGTSIASICKNNSQYKFAFHILANGLTAAAKQKFQELADSLNTEIYLYNLEIELFNDLPTQVHFPIAIYYRYILPLLLDTQKVLYLDADIICNGDIKYLIDCKLANAVVGAVPDVEWMNIKRNKALALNNHRYFNSGVLLINIPLWRQAATSLQAINLLQKNKNKFRYPDQDALNILLQGKVLYLDKKYNCLELDCSSAETVFLHFAAHPKPWNIAWQLSKHCTAAIRDLYKNYEQATPWQNEPLAMPRNYKEMKIYAKGLMQSGCYSQGLYWYAKYISTKLLK